MIFPLYSVLVAIHGVLCLVLGSPVQETVFNKGLQKWLKDWSISPIRKGRENLDILVLEKSRLKKGIH